MLWQGQELCENYFVPDGPPAGRVGLLRPLRWEYFYDEPGSATLHLVRDLLALRRDNAQFRRGGHCFHNDESNYQSRGVLVFSRRLESAYSVVAVNFSDVDQEVPFVFPVGGDYREGLHGFKWPNVSTSATSLLHVPANYGRVWSTEGP